MNSAVHCYHCGETCSSNEAITGNFEGNIQNFCCSGCLFACQLIHDAGESSYYKNRDAFPSSEILKNSSFKIKENEKLASYDIPAIRDKYIQILSDNKYRIFLSISGIHCSSCVFINERILSWTKGIYNATVNYETGRAVVDFDPLTTKISIIISIIQSIGYNAKPIRPDEKSEQFQRQGRSLLWRLVVTGFFAGNTMMVALATWLGYFDASMTEEYVYLFHWLEFIFATPVFLYSADTFHRGWKAFLRSGLPGMDLLISAGISVTYFYSVYATLYRSGPVYFDTVTTIVFFLLIGRYLEWKARYDQRTKMESLIIPPPEYCFRLDKSGNRVQIPVENLTRSDIISAMPGDILPTDGIVTGDECELDESVLTGESKSVIRKPGDRVLAGSKVISGTLEFSADTLPMESSLNALSELARTSGNEKSRMEKFALRLVPWFTAVIILISGFAFIFNYYIIGTGISAAVLSSIAVLIVSCPCALALSVPTAVGSGIYIGLKKGILIRDGAVMENLTQVNKYFFDKTGTLTSGFPSVVDSVYFSDKNKIIEMVMMLEYGSAHPTGRALISYIREKYPEISNKKIVPPSDILHVPGKGIEYTVEDVKIKLGSEVFVINNQYESSNNALEAASFTEKNIKFSNIFYSENGTVKAVFSLRDDFRPATKETVRILSEENEIFILTGDSRSAAASCASDLEIDKDHVFSELTPVEKKNLIMEKSLSSQVCMIGDGFNDSIALSAADVSIVLSRGAPLSLEYAKIILLQNDLKDILVAKKISEKTVKTIRINLIFSLIYNFLAIPFAAAGFLLPVWCAIFMSVSSLTVVGSSIFFRWRGV